MYTRNTQNVIHVITKIPFNWQLITNYVRKNLCRNIIHCIPKYSLDIQKLV